MEITIKAKDADSMIRTILFLSEGCMKDRFRQYKDLALDGCDVELFKNGNIWFNSGSDEKGIQNDATELKKAIRSNSNQASITLIDAL